MDRPVLRTSLRGYRREEVDELIGLVSRALDRSDPVTRAEAAPAARHARFTTVMRGYDRGEVDALVETLHAGLRSDDPAVRQLDSPR